MSRTVIDLDDEATAELMELYNVKSKAAAVRRAIDEAVKLRRRMAFMDAIDSGEIDLTMRGRLADLCAT
ncbi:type II toxin-antitoxin system VapB family antitoxin [Streptomyces griseoflavus]|uniref:type II toxin-antitoxin system VapB family antitoxin n=1 Tax=Streptomyces griseoflavus TaxID=35619 RepID=UPI0001B51684|nr:type II toxin-antitoxin system VapB family antitoxin [Streptomyces griseoflavus]